MIIYGNNFAEKLQSVAISKEYLKNNTPFCDIVDSPEWQVDIDLAVNFNKGISGDLDAANKCVQSLTLNSGTLDYSTLEYYTRKMLNTPIFRSAIYEMRARWDNPDGFDDDFQDAFNNALDDCLNSPCNLFAASSDSIGKMTQSSSTKTTANTFGVGELSSSMVNMVDGLSETILTTIPNIFADAFIEVTAVASKAFENTQAVLAGKENLTVFAETVKSGFSLRDPARSFRYTPDVQSYYDYSAGSSDVLAIIKKEMGGCFDRFQNSFRYNPYNASQNQESPIGTRVGSVNGIPIDEDSLGQPIRYGRDNTARLSGQTEVVSRKWILPTTRDSGDVDPSPIITLTHNSSTAKYTTFAAYADVKNTIVWTDPYKGYDANGNANPNDLKTIAGVGSIGENYLYCPSKVWKSQAGKDILNGKGTTIEGEKRTLASDIYEGWKHNITDEGMHTLYPKNEKVWNDGVAISLGIIRKALNDRNVDFESAKYKSIQKDQQANECFVGAKPAGNSKWAIYKVIDVNSQTVSNVDFTVGAWRHYLDIFKNKMEINSDNAEPIPGVDKWKVVPKITQKEVEGPMEVILCNGSYDAVEAYLNGGPEAGSSGSGAGGSILPALPSNDESELNAALSEVDRLDRERALYGLNDDETDRWLANASEAEKRKEANALADVLDAQSDVLAIKAEQSFNRGMDLAGRSSTN
ncbi:hypothetical protein N9273_00285 [bacterium]|nr:hypothetical protein [bacterium]